MYAREELPPSVFIILTLSYLINNRRPAVYDTAALPLSHTSIFARALVFTLVVYYSKNILKIHPTLSTTTDLRITSALLYP
jgi:hypothetical protein